MLAAMMNVRPSQLLDRDLWRVLGLQVSSEAGEASASAQLAIEGDAADTQEKLRLPVL
jgi:hypothetical protein